MMLNLGRSRSDYIIKNMIHNWVYNKYPVYYIPNSRFYSVPKPPGTKLEAMSSNASEFQRIPEDSEQKMKK